MTLQDKINELQAILQRMRKVQYGDFVLSDDHNSLVDFANKTKEAFDEVQIALGAPAVEVKNPVLVASKNGTPSDLLNLASYVCEGNMDVGGDEAIINQALTEHDTVILAPGVYAISDRIVIPDGKALIGMNKYSAVIAMANNVTSNLYMIYTDGGFVRISNLTIAGNYANPASYSYGIMLYGASNTIIENCIITTIKGHGIGLYNVSEFCIIRDNIITGVTRYGIDLEDYSDFNIIESNMIYGNSQYGINIEEATDNIVIGNIIQGNGIYGILVISYSDRTMIIGNSVISNGRTGVYFWTSSYGVIKGNLIGSNGDHGISLYGSSHNTIIGNAVIRVIMTESVSMENRITITFK